MPEIFSNIWVSLHYSSAHTEYAMHSAHYSMWRPSFLYFWGDFLYFFRNISSYLFLMFFLPPPPPFMDTLAAFRWGSREGPNLDDWRKSLVLCLLCGWIPSKTMDILETKTKNKWKEQYEALCILFNNKYFDSIKLSFFLFIDSNRIA